MKTCSEAKCLTNWRIKDQLDVTCYFISLLVHSTCFGQEYIHHQELAIILLNYHIGLLFLVRCVLEFRCGCVGVVPVLLASVCNTDTTPTEPHRNANTHRTKNNTTNVVIQQNSRKLLMMDILMSETCWAHKKWNKIASDIKLVLYSSTITMMHGPINIRCLPHIQSRLEQQREGIQKGSYQLKKWRLRQRTGI